MTLLDTVRVQASLADAIIGHRIEYHRLIGSTMDVARELAREGAAEGTVVIAEEQNKGRGRFDRAWVSPPDLNLYFTVLLRPQPDHLPYMNMAAALGVYEAAAEITGLKPTVKWPNDVRIDGRKLSGILVETEFDGPRLDHSLVGVGVKRQSGPIPAPRNRWYRHEPASGGGKTVRPRRSAPPRAVQDRRLVRAR